MAAGCDNLSRMNITIRTRPLVPLPPAPRKYSAADIFFFAEAGLLDDAVKFELFDGEIIPMSPKGNEHESMRLKIARWLRGSWANKFDSLQEHTLTVDGDTFVEPDFILFKGGRKDFRNPLAGAEIHLVIEVADSSLRYDLTKKATKYAAFGVEEYWVVNATTRETSIHRAPNKKGWAERLKVPAGKPLSPLCAPKASLKL